MIIFKLEVLIKDSYGEDDYTIGFYSTKELAFEAYAKYVKIQDKGVIEDNLRYNEDWPLFEENHCSFIIEYELDDFSWENE